MYIINYQTRLNEKGNRHNNTRGYTKYCCKGMVFGRGWNYIYGFIGHHKHCRVNGATIHLRNDIHRRITYIFGGSEGWLGCGI